MQSVIVQISAKRWVVAWKSRVSNSYQVCTLPLENIHQASKWKDAIDNMDYFEYPSWVTERMLETNWNS